MSNLINDMSMFLSGKCNNHEFDISYKHVLPDQMKAAKMLFETVSSVLNKSASSTVSVEANFFEIGGNSLNSVYIVLLLKKKGYNIGEYNNLKSVICI